MPDSVLEKLIQGYMATPQPAYSFVWQGGEPTLMGLDFFRKVTDLQKTNWNKFCKTCDFLTLCRGDCLKHRMHGNHPARNLSRLCSGWKQFFEHSAHKFNELAQTIRVERLNNINHNRTQRNHTVSKVIPVGRNQTCPCGSGKKFKKCCGYRP